MSISTEIKHQTQPTPMSCVCTCIAMLINRPVSEVVDEWHHAYFVDQTVEVHEILHVYGVNAKQQLAGNVQTLRSCSVYILTVASLNIRGGLHQVILDFRDPALPRVYDPAKGYGNRFYYTLDTMEADEVDNAVVLFSWILDYVIEVPNETETSCEVPKGSAQRSEPSDVGFNQKYEG